MLRAKVKNKNNKKAEGEVAFFLSLALVEVLKKKIFCFFLGEVALPLVLIFINIFIPFARSLLSRQGIKIIIKTRHEQRSKAAGKGKNKNNWTSATSLLAKEAFLFFEPLPSSSSR
jgi:hypothetical protein